MSSKKNSKSILGKLKRPKFPVTGVLLLLGILLVAGAVIWVLLFSGYSFSGYSFSGFSFSGVFNGGFSNSSRTGDPPIDVDKLTVTVPWNEGSMADMTVRALTDSKVDNISGSNGAAGINEVYASPLDGLNILGTNLSSMVLSRLTGFTETSVSDWEFWLIASSPCVAAVRGDSDFASLDDLLSAAAASPAFELTAANAGGGTMSFIAAHLFAENYGISIEHRDFPGINPAINDILNGAADLIIAPRSDMISFLNSGELREIKTDSLFEMHFGEWYGLMLPKGAKEDIMLFYDELWNEAVSSEGFVSFLTDNGLLPVQPDRGSGRETAASMAEMIERVLLDSGYVSK